MGKEVKIEVSLPQIPKDRLELFLDFLAELLAKEYIKEQTTIMEKTNYINVSSLLTNHTNQYFFCRKYLAKSKGNIS